jgi:hypothetical protein
MILSQET